MNQNLCSSLFACLAVLLFHGQTQASDWPGRYDVVWTEPSSNASGSMPIGNGDIGLNVWAESAGEISFYIGKTDAWSENARLLKLGKIRLVFSPNPFAAGTTFTQRLNLAEGAIEIRADAFTAKIWVDAHRPVIWVDVRTEKPISLKANLDLWRNHPRLLEGAERHSAYGLSSSPDPVRVYADTILSSHGEGIVWCHSNRASIWPMTLERQGMAAWREQAPDPLLGRTFGGVLYGAGLVRRSERTLGTAKARKNYLLKVVLLTEPATSVPAWKSRLDSLQTSVERVPQDSALIAQQRWWRDFWDRSHVLVSGAADADIVTRAYVLQRFINACAGRGVFPPKFNGSIFTVDAAETDANFDADYRRWGGPYWFQNTRLIYWPMLASGDFDMMQPLFRMYRAALPFAVQRTRTYFAHGGAFFPEVMYFWGAYAQDNYGWQREEVPVGVIDNQYIRYYYSGALELLTLMQSYHEFIGDTLFLQQIYLPLAGEILAFYDQHYPRDNHGRLRIEPAQALETWWTVVNPMPELAGLRRVLGDLLQLPPAALADSTRKAWQMLYECLPPLPQADDRLLAAEDIQGEVKNLENPELYAVFPYRLYGVGKDDLLLARASYAARRVQGSVGWQQDDTQAAFLGLADQARKLLVERFSKSHPGSRFPAFWGPNYDWIPDQDHGNNGLMALQSMILQWEGRKIYLLPAWPSAWDVSFKLHAPLATVIEGEYRGGVLQNVRVDPEWRRADIVWP